jgi:hypothetical protein
LDSADVEREEVVKRRGADVSEVGDIPVVGKVGEKDVEGVIEAAHDQEKYKDYAGVQVLVVIPDVREFFEVLDMVEQDEGDVKAGKHLS